MTNLKILNFKKCFFWTFVIGILLVISNLALVIPAYAQDISLSITPPLLELMIQPGKETSQRYILTNNGAETPLKIKIVPFSPADEYGNVKLEDISLYTAINISNWFKIGGRPVNENQKLFLPRGGNQDIILNISPPEHAPEGDYYLTLLFETNSSALLGGHGATSNAQIGSNILLTVSKSGNPTKSAEIVKFQAPKLVDSLGKINYSIKIKNTGNAFFKPTGSIDVSSLFGSNETLNLAPQNILASSIREIPCTKDEQLVKCTLSKNIHIGIYNARLKFSLDDGKDFYEAQAITIAFPFSITASFLICILLIKIIFKKLKK